MTHALKQSRQDFGTLNLTKSANSSVAFHSHPKFPEKNLLPVLTRVDCEKGEAKSILNIDNIPQG